MERKRYERTVPSGKTKLVTIALHGRAIEDIAMSLAVFADRSGRARGYVSRDGELVVAVDNWTA